MARSERSRVRRAMLIVAGILGAAAATLAIEVAIATRSERIPPYDREQLDGEIGEAGDGDGPRVRLVWLGDSTGDGVGASTPDHALPRVVAAALGRPIRLSVLAHSGDRVADVLRDQVPALGSLQPDWVIVCIGGNDVTHLTSRRAFRARMGTLLTRVRAAAATRIVVVGVGEFAATPLLAQPLRAIAGARADRLNTDARAVARAHGALFVDIIEATGRAFVSDPKGTHARDGFHPSDAGYRLWADAIVAAIRSAGW